MDLYPKESIDELLLQLRDDLYSYVDMVVSELTERLEAVEKKKSYKKDKSEGDAQ